MWWNTHISRLISDVPTTGNTVFLFIFSISGSRLNLNQILYMLEVPFIQSTVVLVLNDNMHINIKPYFCLAYRSILKYRGIRCFPGRDLPNSFVRFSVSQNVNKYGISALAVSER